MNARQWTAVFSLVAVVLLLMMSILSGSGEHQAYARLNPSTGKMEIIDPVLLAGSRWSGKGKAHGVSTETEKSAPSAPSASLAAVRLAVQTSDKTNQFVE